MWKSTTEIEPARSFFGADGFYGIGRASPYSLYDQDLVTFEEGQVAYDHNDASGFNQAQRPPFKDAGEAAEEGGGQGVIAPPALRPA